MWRGVLDFRQAAKRFLLVEVWPCDGLPAANDGLVGANDGLTAANESRSGRAHLP